MDSRTNKQAPNTSHVPATDSLSIFSTYDPPKPSRLHSFAGSLAIQIVVLLLLIFVSTATPKLIEKAQKHSITWIAPADTQPKLAPPPKIQVAPPPPRLTVPPDVTAKLELPTIHVPTPQPVVAPAPVPVPKVPVHTNFDQAVAQETKPQPARTVATNVFQNTATTTQARATAAVQTGSFGNAPTTTASSRQVTSVQTGAFGDPNGVPVSKSGARGKVSIASVGSFGAPAASGPAGGRQQGQVSQTQFTLAAAETSRKPATEIRQPSLTPVTILSKPSPKYSEEARRMRIEGEVLINVVFTATGNIRVVGVARGLGHGLDEAAIAAAQQVKFTPALRDGVKVDSSATLHIVFALS